MHVGVLPFILNSTTLCLANFFLCFKYYFYSTGVDVHRLDQDEPYKKVVTTMMTNKVFSSGGLECFDIKCKIIGTSVLNINCLTAQSSSERLTGTSLTTYTILQFCNYAKHLQPMSFLGYNKQTKNINKVNIALFSKMHPKLRRL